MSTRAWERGPLILAAAWLALAATGCSDNESGSPSPAVQSPPAADASPASTEAIIYAPFTGSGLAPDVEVTQTARGTCQTSIVLQRGDAYRCFLTRSVNGAGIVDPCFAGGYPTTMICPTAPTDPSVLQVTSTNRLAPATLDADPMLDDPWQVQLTDGQVCTFLTGASYAIRDLRLNYACPNGELFGSPDTSTSTWTVFYRQGETASLTRVDIEKAWY